MMLQRATATLPIAQENLKVEKTETDVIVFDEASEAFHFLNAAAYSILKACNGSNNMKDIAGILSLEYNCEDMDSLFADVSETIRLLQDKGLVAVAIDDQPFNGRSGETVLDDALMTVMVSGISMFPVLLSGDKALVRKTKCEDLRIGDIIVWARQLGDLVVHRITLLDLTSNPVSIVTKGDLLLEHDEPIEAGQILGKLVAVLRGGQVQWLRQIETNPAVEPALRDQPAQLLSGSTDALPKKGSFSGIKVLDLREISADAIRNIESVRDVSLVLLSPENAFAWSDVTAQDITSVITVPTDYRVYTGQPELLPELLEFVQEPLKVLVSGQIFLTGFRPDQILKVFAHLMLSGQAYVSSAEAKAALESITTTLSGHVRVIASEHARWIGESLLGPEYQQRNGELPLVAVGELRASERLTNIPESASQFNTGLQKLACKAAQ